MGLGRIRHEVRRLVTLAWPIVVGQLGLMGMGVVDTLVVGRLDQDALAAMSLANTWSFAGLIVGIGTAMGLDPLLAQAHGARDDAAYDRAVVLGAGLLTVMSVPLTLHHLVAAPVLGWLGQPAALLPLVEAYAWSIAPSAWPLLMFGLLRQALQGRERVLVPMAVILAGNGVNLVADLLLLEAMGPVGVGWASTVVRWVSLGALVVLAPRERRALWAGWPVLRDLRRWGRAAWVSVPVGLQSGLEIWAFSVSTLVMGTFGSTALAAHAVTMNVAGLAFMVPLGLSSAAAIRVANQLGAGGDWRLSGRVALGVGTGVMALSAAALWTGPGLVVALYLPDAPDAAALALTLLPLAALFQLADGLQVVSFGVLRGVGDTRVPALANVVGYGVVGLPGGMALAWLTPLGPQGVWLGLTMGLTTVAVLLGLRLRVMGRRVLERTVV